MQSELLKIYPPTFVLTTKNEAKDDAEGEVILEFVSDAKDDSCGPPVDNSFHQDPPTIHRQLTNCVPANFNMLLSLINVHHCMSSVAITTCVMMYFS